MGYEVYTHMKAFYIAIGLPFSGRGKIRCFHIFGSIILSILALTQVFLTKSLMYISFYQIIGSREIMDIFKNAAGILFIDQIGDFVGIFFRMWIKDNVRGYRHLTAETYYRNEMEFQAKFVALCNISITVVITYLHWHKDPNQVIISYHWYF